MIRSNKLNDEKLRGVTEAKTDSGKYLKTEKVFLGGGKNRIYLSQFVTRQYSFPN